MRSTYESIFIIKPTLSDEETEKVIQKMQEIITTGGGEIINVENWGKKKLAYEIKKHKRGHYVLLHLKAEGPLVKELERNYRLSDAVIKFITVKLKGDIVLQKPATQSESKESPVKSAAAQQDAPVAEKGESTVSSETAESSETVKE
jgi:small subunit ribosomal protein S6